ncbi:MAG: CHRD domain-containing protein [Allosphingosinicella sp.]
MKTACVPISALGLVAGLALAGCTTVAEATHEGVTASLTGSQEVPGPGDNDGSGDFEINFVDVADNLCFELRVRQIDPATAAHIHRGARGVSGPPVVTLETPADGDSGQCISVPQALSREIEANPGGFYVNVHNGRYPNGAIRGQLGR